MNNTIKCYVLVCTYNIKLSRCGRRELTIYSSGKCEYADVMNEYSEVMKE